jgi:hypothetical protein
MAAISLFWYTNMAAVTSDENDLYCDKTLSLGDDSSSITIQDNQVTQRPDSPNFVPSFLLSNTMSLAPKVDEIRSVVLNHPVDFACFTETWLTDSVHNNVINIPGFNIHSPFQTSS